MLESGRYTDSQIANIDKLLSGFEEWLRRQ